MGLIPHINRILINGYKSQNILYWLVHQDLPVRDVGESQTSQYI